MLNNFGPDEFCVVGALLHQLGLCVCIKDV